MIAMNEEGLMQQNLVLQIAYPRALYLWIRLALFSSSFTVHDCSIQIAQMEFATPIRFRKTFANCFVNNVFQFNARIQIAASEIHIAPIQPCRKQSSIRQKECRPFCQLHAY